jgi:hypothetical protein
MSARIKRIAARSVLVAMLVGLGCLIAASAAVANPPGIPAGYHKVFQFNVIGYPEGQSYNGNCGNGRRIFVNRNTSNAKVRVSEEGVWQIVDCDATADKTAKIYSDMPAEYVVYARILGKPHGDVTFCYGTVTDYESGEDLCEIGSFNLHREGGKSQFGIAPRDMFDEDLEDIMWQVQTNSDFRIAQFRVYRVE